MTTEIIPRAEYAVVDLETGELLTSVRGGDILYGAHLQPHVPCS